MFQRVVLHSQSRYVSHVPTLFTLSRAPLQPFKFPTTVNIAPISLAPRHTQVRHFNLKQKVRSLRMMGFRGTDTTKHWDPYDQKPRDGEIGLSAAQLIQKQAKMQREKQLEHIKKINEKMAQRDNPSLVVKKPLKERLSAKIVVVKQSLLSSKRPAESEMSLLQKMVYVYWKHSIIGVLILFGGLYVTPPVRTGLAHLLEFNRRRRDGVLGLDEYCNPTRCNAELVYAPTGDFSFDVRYLQKMTLRDIYVLGLGCEEMRVALEKRKELLTGIQTILSMFDEEINKDGGKNLSPTQREAALMYSQVLEPFQQELAECDTTMTVMTQQWPETLASLKEQFDVKLDGFFAKYLQGENHQRRVLDQLKETQSGLEDWKHLLHNELRTFHQRNEVLQQLHTDLTFSEEDFYKSIVEGNVDSFVANHNKKRYSPPSSALGDWSDTPNDVNTAAIDQFKQSRQNVREHA